MIFVSYAASASTAQRFAEAGARNDGTTLRALALRTAGLTSIMTLATGVALLIASPLLLGLFGPGFSGSTGLLAILVVGAVAQSAFGPGEDLLTMLGHERTCALVAFGVLVLAVLLNVALIPVFGAMGAAMATALAATVRGGALAVVVERRLGFAPHIFARGRR